jgi:hypothetical protein
MRFSGLKAAAMIVTIDCYSQTGAKLKLASNCLAVAQHGNLNVDTGWF